MARVFLYVPTLYHISFRVLPSCPLQLERGPLDGSVPSLRATIKDNQKQGLENALAVCSALLFFVFLILPGRRRTLNLQTRALRRVARRGVCVALRARCGLPQLRAILDVWGLACLARCHARLRGSARLLRVPDMPTQVSHAVLS